MALANAFLLADDLLARWLVENSPIKIPFFQAWLWQSISGNPLKYTRTTEIRQAELVGDCRVVNEQLPTMSDVEFPFLEFITRCSVDLDTFQHPNQLEAVLYALAKRRLLYVYADFIADGVNPRSLVGICDPARRVNLGGGGLTLDCLDDAYERVVANTGRPTLIMSSSRGLRTYRSLCRLSGYQPERSAWSWYHPGGRPAGSEDSVDAFNGTPWLANDFINKDGVLPAEERIFFMVMGDDGGPSPTRGVTGIIPAAQGRNIFNKRVVEGILDTSTPTPAMAPGTDTWITMPAALALGSQGALSIIENFTTVSGCDAPPPA